MNEVEKEQLKLIILASLVHDVGKFAQRAKAEKSPEDLFLQPQDFKKRTSHWHVLYTDYFVKNILPLPKDLEHRREDIALLASIHHNPFANRLDQYCISKADRLASGIDRIETPAIEEFRKARLISIFEEVRLKSLLDKDFDGLKRMLLSPFLFDKRIFPVDMEPQEKYEKKDIFVQEYKDLYKKFVDELNTYTEQLKELNFTHYISWILRIFEKYMWCIPSSSYKTVPDISLYDHLVVTASVAQALWIYHQETGKQIELNPTDNKSFILLGADLSGIQRYIFGVSETGKGLTKLIRGRSFYLQLLTRSIVLHILNEIELYYPALIMDSAGKFILLLPNTDNVKEFIYKLLNKIDEFFVRKFKGILTISFAQKETTEKELLLKNFSYTLDELNQLLEMQKNRKLFNYLTSSGSVIGFDYDKFSQNGVCDICGIHPAEEENICSICNHQKTIGEKLPKTKYIVFNRITGIPLFEDIKVLLKEKDDFYPNKMDLVYGIREDAQKYATMWLASYLPKIQEEELEDELFLKTAIEELETEEKQELIGKPKTLELISYSALKKAGDEVLGKNFLCVLKADVDNLGLIFSIGLQNRLSLSRYASLSRMLNAFFSGYLVEKIKSSQKYRDIYVVFAGGDDLFLIGPWHQSIDFALEIRNEFKKFCANNKDISISCGFYIMRSKYPVRRAAREAEELLDKAKERREGSVLIKDGVCIFDQVLSWDELKDQVEFGKWLEKKVLESKINRGFIYRLLNYVKSAKRCEEATEVSLNDLLFYSHALYDIARNLIQTNKEGEIVNKDEVEYILNRLNPFRENKKIGNNIVGIQYALYAIRRFKKEEK